MSTSLILLAAIAVRNPFWPIDYEGTPEEITAEPRVVETVEAPVVETPTRSAADLAKEEELRKQKLEEEMKQYKEQDEDVLSYALFPQVATEFFKYRETQRTKVDPTIADTENKVYPV